MTREVLSASVIGFALAVAVSVVYAPVADYEFLAYDDVLYVTENARVQAGLSAEMIGWALASTEAGNWHPLVWLSHAADVELFGLDAGSHHLTSVAIHACATALLFGVLWSLTGSLLASALGAGLFGLHPLRLESVAWIAERKDVLCGLFSIASLGAALRHARAPSAARLAIVALCVCGALMSKAMAVTLPVALILFDVWPLGRLRSGPRGLAGGVPTMSMKRLLAEKLPLLALSLAASAVAVRAQSTGGALTSVGVWPLSSRLANAASSYWIYLRKTLWPDDLAVFYPYSPDGIESGQTLLAAFALSLVSAVALYAWRARSNSEALPAFSFAWFWFVGTLIPVIGIVTVGEQALADRYTYIPHLGFAIVLACGLAYAEQSTPRVRWIAMSSAAVALVGCIGATSSMLPHWENDRTLFRRALEVTDQSRVAHLNYGNALEGVAPVEEQIRHFERAVELGPTDANAHYHLGRALALNGELVGGVEHYRMSLAFDSMQPKTWNNLGAVLERLGDGAGAVASYRQALEVDPTHPSSNFNLALSLLREAQNAEARILAQRYVAEAFAAVAFEDKLGALARAFADAGDLDTACELLAAASLESAELYALTGTLEWQRGNEKHALAAAQSALVLEPTNSSIANNLAWMLATAREAPLRDPSRAVELARQAISSSPAGAGARRDPALLDTLGAAHAAAGDFEAAVMLGDEAVGIAEASRGEFGSEFIDKLRSHAAAYKARRPLHELDGRASADPGDAETQREGEARG
ncbi:MAG: tetratricopeptide repeat protein [Myxococcota bacterium]|nr:tetratricopeptide repeat protein [Myxococcota bacterium]